MAVVSDARLELAQYFYYTDLSRVCLPVSPIRVMLQSPPTAFSTLLTTIKVREPHFKIRLRYVERNCVSDARAHSQPNYEINRAIDPWCDEGDSNSQAFRQLLLRQPRIPVPTSSQISHDFPWVVITDRYADQASHRKSGHRRHETLYLLLS